LEMTHLGKKRRGRTKEIEKPARWWQPRELCGVITELPGEGRMNAHLR
jgi:hypothetical protein